MQYIHLWAHGRTSHQGEHPAAAHARRILVFLNQRVTSLDNPRSIGEALAGSALGNDWKYRVGDRRIICDLQDQRIVVRVRRVGNRREGYR